MDERSDFGSLEHSRLASAAASGLYGPSAAAAAAVNSGLIQLPSFGDTAGRLGVMDGCSGLPPSFGCPPGLHPDYSSMNSLAQLHGWYRPAGPSQNSSYSDLFGSYIGQGGNWRNLSTPPTASDHFHSPLPGMTHPMWPCPPTPVPCTDGCSMSYYNTPNMYSAYSAYMSLLSNSTVTDYPPYLSPRFPGSIPSYQQRLHDRHKAFLLASSGCHGSPEFLSPWNPYLGGPSSIAGPLHSPVCLGASEQLAFGRSSEEGSLSSKSVGEEQKQNIKQEPVPSKLKVKDGFGEHRGTRDSSKRDQHRSCGHSSVTNLEILHDTKPGLTSRKFLKDEKLLSPVSNESSLDLRSNNNNNANITNNNNLSASITNDSVPASSDFQSADDILFTEAAAAAENGDVLIDQKPPITAIPSSEAKENDLSESAKPWPINSGCQGSNNGAPLVVNEPAGNPDSSQIAPLPDDRLPEAKRTVDGSSVASGSTILDEDHMPKASVCQSAVDKVLHTDSSVANDLISNSKMEAELRKSPDIINSAVISKDNAPLPHPVTGNQSLLNDQKLAGNSVESSDKSSCIIHHSLFFEEISNDGIDSNDKDLKSQGEAQAVKTSESVVNSCWITSFPPVSNLPDSRKMESDLALISLASLASSFSSQSSPVISTLSFSCASEPSAVMSSSSPLSSVVSLVLPSPQPTAQPTTSSQTTVLPSTSSDVSSSLSTLKTSTAAVAKSDASNTYSSHSMALTLYMDNSVKLTKTSVSDGLSSSGGSQEIDLAMPRQSMRYQVSHHRQNSMQDGCKVHAPTFLPEVCTLPCNTITTITMSSSISPGLLRSTPSGKIGGGIISAKPATGQRTGRSQTKLRSSSLAGCNAEVLVKTEKNLKSSPDFESANEIKDVVVAGKTMISNQTAGSTRRSVMSDKGQMDAISAHPFVPMDFSASKTWNKSFTSGSFSDVLPSDNYHPFRSVSSQSHANVGCKPSKFSSSQFTMAELNTVTSVTPSLGKNTFAGALEVKKSANTAHNKSSCERNQIAGSNGQSDSSVSKTMASLTTTLSGKTKGFISHWDYNNVPENLSTKPLASEVDGETVSSDSAKRPLVKQTLMMSNISKDGGQSALGRLPNSIQDGSSGIPVGIARALQRTIPQPASASSAAGDSGTCLLDDHTLPASVERPDAPSSEANKSESSRCSGNSSSNVGSGDKPGLLCVQSLPSNPNPTETGKQSCRKNDIMESRPHILSSSFNHAWLQGVPPTTISASINPAAAVWVGQFPPFHHRALLPYASTSIDRNQSQHLFHPAASGYKLAQDSMTGQFFFIPVPDIPWANVGSCIIPDSNALNAHKDQETIRTVDSCSPVANHSTSEVQSDTNAEIIQPSSESTLLQPTDLSVSSLQSNTDNSSSSSVDVGRIGQFPIIFPATRPPYFYCDSQFFIQDPRRQIERTRVCVESRGTSPIQHHPDVESTDGTTAAAAAADSRDVLKTVKCKGEKDDLEKATLNVSVQTSQSLLLMDPVEKACTAEISIQTSDLSDNDSVSSEAVIKDKRMDFKLRKQKIPFNQNSTDSAVGSCGKIGLKTTSTSKQTSSTSPEIKDTALSDISSDEIEYNSSQTSSGQKGLSKFSLLTAAAAAASAAALDGIEGSRIDGNRPSIACDSCDKSEIFLESFSPEPVFDSLPICTGKKFFYLVQAASAGLGNNSAGVHESDFKAESSQGLEDLVLLSTIASSQLPAAAAAAAAAASNVFSHQEVKEEENFHVASVRKLNIFDLNPSEFVESEHSPDVSTSYNVPKSCFFGETEFISSSNGCVRYSNSEEPKVDDVKSGILKSDEGPENMDPMELELRMRMAEVQLKYKQKQKELARLQRKNNELRNNSNMKRKKSKPMPKQTTIQRKQSTTSRQLYTSSDDSSDSSTDTEESGRDALKKIRTSKSDAKCPATSSVHSASNLSHAFSGIKIKVSNPQKKTSSALSPNASSQFQMNSCRSLKLPSKKENRYSVDSLKKSFISSNKQEQLKHTTDRARSLSTSAAECSRGLEMKRHKPEQPKKLNIIAENVMLKKKPRQFCFYSYKKNKTSSSNKKDIKKHKLQVADAKNGAKNKFTSKADAGNQKTVDDEWYRRRSERIFLHEASVSSMSSPTILNGGQMNFGDERSLPLSPSKPSTKPPRTLSQESGLKTLPSCQKTELSVTLKTCIAGSIQTSTSKKQTASGSSDTDTNSDTDDAPLSTLVHKESFVELRSCSIGKDELTDNLRVLYLKDGHFYEGTVKAVLPPDVYRVNIDGERSSRQELVSQEELLQKAILNIRPTSKDQLQEGSRICAYWSQKFSCLYPGTVKSHGDNSDDDEDDENTVHVEFDDGDRGKIPLTHISMLPPGYKIQESEISSVLMPGNRKRRITADEPVSVDTLQRPSAILRSMSMMESPSYCHLLNHSTHDAPSGLKQISSVRNTSSGERLGTHAPGLLERKIKSEKQEYSCRLKTESGGDTSSTDLGFGPVGKKSSQKKVEGFSSSEMESLKMSDLTVEDQKKSNLTLTIKRKQSRDHETSISSSDDDEDSTSDEDETKKNHKRRHLRLRKKMKLEEVDQSSASDADETSNLEESRKRDQKRRRRSSSHRSTKSRRRHRSSSESGDQIGAFRPVWEQWQWYGPCTRRPGMKGKAKKQFYRAIQRGSEILKIGDAAVFVSMGHNDLQYVGCIDSLWESWDGNMVVKVKWYYHPEETKGGKRLLEIKSALYQSSHEDENDVQTVSHKCEVLSYTNFKKFQVKKYSVDCKPEDVFYLAGTYDPTISMITYEQDVPLKSH